jgi:hypothetical protein
MFVGFVEGYLATKLLNASGNYGLERLKKLWKDEALVRLLLLLHIEFAEQSQLDLEGFLAIQTDAEFRVPVSQFLRREQALDVDAVAGAIARHLHGVGDSGRLAQEMAEAIERLAPSARDGTEGEAFISRQLENGFLEIRSDLVGFESRMIEQIRGVEKNILQRLSPPEVEPEAERPSAARPSDAAAAPIQPLEGVLGEALLGGALRRAGHGNSAAEVRRLTEEGSHAAAGELLAEIATAMERQGLLPIAESYREQAAEAFHQAGNADAAAQLLLAVIKSRLHRASDAATLTISRLRQVLPADQQWIAEGLAAVADWPGRGALAVDALRQAMEHSVGRADERQWRAWLVEVLVIGGRFEEAIDAAEAGRRIALGGGPRLDLELDFLDAAEEVTGPDSVEGAWTSLLEWAGELEIQEPILAAEVFQRRAVTFTLREKNEEAASLFNRALSAWSRVPGWEDQVAEAYFATQTAASLRGELHPEGAELRPLAAAMRGSAETPAGIAADLESRGMRARIDGKHYEALRAYWLAFAIHRRVGNLRGQLFELEMLAELYLAAGRPAQAVPLYIAAGRDSRARKAALNAPIDDVWAFISLSGPRWQRSASFAVVSEIGRRLSEDHVAQIAPHLIEEARADVTSLISPQPVLRAREALAAVALALPEEDRAAGIELLRELTIGDDVRTSRPASEALILMTNAGQASEAVLLTEAFLADPSLRGISSIWVAEQAERDARVRDLISRAARDGHVGALEVAAAAELAANDQELQHQSDEHVSGVASSATIEEQREGAHLTRSVQLVSFEGAGIVARYCEPVTRNRFVARMLEVIDSAEEPELNRASAANALFNVAGHLDAEDAARVVACLREPARGQYSPSEWDESASQTHDPFSRFQLKIGSAGAFWAAALQALARVTEHHGLEPASVEAAVRSALDNGPIHVIAAAFDALARVPTLQSPVPVEAALQHPDQQVRLNALGCWHRRANRLPSGDALERLVQDPAMPVRLMVLKLAVGDPAEERVVRALISDEDAYVRALAKRRAQNGGSRLLRRPSSGGP